MTPELSDEAVARTTPPGSSRRWVLRAGTLGLFVGGALALGVGTAAMASAAGPHAKPAAKAPAPTKTSPTAGTTTVSSLGATCSENSFFSGSPAAGSTVSPGDHVSVLYFDESEINPGGVGKNGVTALKPTFLVNGNPTSTAVDVGPLFSKGATSGGFTGLDKYNHVLTATVPSGATGTVGIIAYDGDQNKTGGDCGVISWTVKATPPPPPTQDVGADILICSNGSPTSSPVAGGLISETDGPTSIKAGQPIPSTSVAPGTYAFHAEAPNGYNLVACGQSSANDKSVNVTSGSSKTVHFYVQAQQKAPDLAIIKIASVSKVKVGNTLVYSLAVSNVGSGPTTGKVTVTDTVPSGLAITNVAGGSAWSCSTLSQAISCDYQDGVIQAGDKADGLITITTQVQSTAPTVLVNTGVVDTPGDINPANNRSTVRTPVLKVLGTKTVKPATPAVLPFTGAKHTAVLVELAMLLLTLGLGLVIAGTSRRRSPALAG
jgi:uncharacterized repeat protein (TIGR01451 family)